MAVVRRSLDELRALKRGRPPLQQGVEEDRGVV